MTRQAACGGAGDEIGRLCQKKSWGLAGVSAIVKDSGGYWFEVTKQKYWLERSDGCIVIGIGAIGGNLESGESALDCLQREAVEEIGAGLEIDSASTTHIVYEESQICTVRSERRGCLCPALYTVSANLTRQQDLPHLQVLAIETYLARLTKPPTVKDLYGLVWLPAESVGRMLVMPEFSAARLQSESDVRLLLDAPLPKRAVFRPVWTVRSLQLLCQAGVFW